MCLKCNIRPLVILWQLEAFALQIFIISQQLVFALSKEITGDFQCLLCTLLLSTLDSWKSQAGLTARSLLGRLLLLGQGLDDLLLLGCETLFSALTSLLCLGTTSLGLITVGQRNKVSHRCSSSTFNTLLHQRIKILLNLKAHYYCYQIILGGTGVTRGQTDSRAQLLAAPSRYTVENVNTTLVLQCASPECLISRNTQLIEFNRIFKCCDYYIYTHFCLFRIAHSCHGPGLPLDKYRTIKQIISLV